MKITRVECFPISYPRQRPGGETIGMPSLFVKIHTDEGIVGKLLVAEGTEAVKVNIERMALVDLLSRLESDLVITDIGGDYVLGIATDELGIERIRLHAIRKPGSK